MTLADVVVVSDDKDPFSSYDDLDPCDTPEVPHDDGRAILRVDEIAPASSGDG